MIIMLLVVVLVSCFCCGEYREYQDGRDEVKYSNLLHKVEQLSKREGDVRFTRALFTSTRQESITAYCISKSGMPCSFTCITIQRISYNF